MPELMQDSDRPQEGAPPSAGGDRRAYPRRPAPEVFVALETPAEAPGPPGRPAWAGNAVDISGGGLAMPLPDEVSVGAELLLTFYLEDGTAFVRVPSTVVRNERGFGIGAVAFEGWDDAKRLTLLAYLARN